MKGSKLSLLLAGVLLSAAATAAAAEQGSALFCGKLDLACPSFAGFDEPMKAPLIGFQPLDSKHAGHAYVIRFGEGKKKNEEPRWIVQLGNTFRQAMFWAAVATVLL